MISTQCLVGMFLKMVAAFAQPDGTDSNAAEPDVHVAEEPILFSAERCGCFLGEPDVICRSWQIGPFRFDVYFRHSSAYPDFDRPPTPLDEIVGAVLHVARLYPHDVVHLWLVGYASIPEYERGKNDPLSGARVSIVWWLLTASPDLQELVRAGRLHLHLLAGGVPAEPHCPEAVTGEWNPSGVEAERREHEDRRVEAIILPDSERWQDDSVLRALEDTGSVSGSTYLSLDAGVGDQSAQERTVARSSSFGSHGRPWWDDRALRDAGFDGGYRRVPGEPLSSSQRPTWAPDGSGIPYPEYPLPTSWESVRSGRASHGGAALRRTFAPAILEPGFPATTDGDSSHVETGRNGGPAVCTCSSGRVIYCPGPAPVGGSPARGPASPEVDRPIASVAIDAAALEPIREAFDQAVAAVGAWLADAASPGLCYSIYVAGGNVQHPLGPLHFSEDEQRIALAIASSLSTHLPAGAAPCIETYAGDALPALEGSTPGRGLVAYVLPTKHANTPPTVDPGTQFAELAEVTKQLACLAPNVWNPPADDLAESCRTTTTVGAVPVDGFKICRHGDLSDGEWEREVQGMIAAYRNRATYLYSPWPVAFTSEPADALSENGVVWRSAPCIGVAAWLLPLDPSTVVWTGADAAAPHGRIVASALADVPDAPEGAYADLEVCWVPADASVPPSCAPARPQSAADYSSQPSWAASPSLGRAFALLAFTATVRPWGASPVGWLVWRFRTGWSDPPARWPEAPAQATRVVNRVCMHLDRATGVLSPLAPSACLQTGIDVADHDATLDGQLVRFIGLTRGEFQLGLGQLTKSLFVAPCGRSHDSPLDDAELSAALLTFAVGFPEVDWNSGIRLSSSGAGSPMPSRTDGMVGEAGPGRYDETVAAVIDAQRGVWGGGDAVVFDRVLVRAARIGMAVGPAVPPRTVVLPDGAFAKSWMTRAPAVEATVRDDGAIPPALQVVCEPTVLLLGRDLGIERPGADAATSVLWLPIAVRSTGADTSEEWTCELMF
jgi:hypothetical protein